jgi:hypothetical protein
MVDAVSEQSIGVLLQLQTPQSKILQHWLEAICAVSPPALPPTKLRGRSAAATKRALVWSHAMARFQSFLWTQLVRYNGVDGWNYVFGPFLEEDAIWLTAHHDYIGGIGAEDNASSLAVMLEVARLLPTHLKKKVVFASFAFEEEASLAGSEHFVKSVIDRNLITKPKCVVCLECLGAGSKLVACQTMKGDLHEMTPWVVDELVEAGEGIVVAEPTTGFWSDAVSFLKVGVPVATFCSYDPPTAVSRTYHTIVHTSHDTLDAISYEQLATVVEVLLRFLKNQLGENQWLGCLGP